MSFHDGFDVSLYFKRVFLDIIKLKVWNEVIIVFYLTSKNIGRRELLNYKKFPHVQVLTQEPLTDLLIIGFPNRKCALI